MLGQPLDFRFDGRFDFPQFDLLWFVDFINYIQN